MMGLTLASVLVADPALARRGRGVPPEISLRPAADGQRGKRIAKPGQKPVAAPAAGPVERPLPPRRLVKPGRHGSKQRGRTQHGPGR